jgi:hypothetical protein
MKEAGPEFHFSNPKVDGRGDKLSAKRDYANRITCPALRTATYDFLYAVRGWGKTGAAASLERGDKAR